MHLDGYWLEIECRWGRIHAKLLTLGAEPPAYDSFSPAAAVPESLFSLAPDVMKVPPEVTTTATTVSSFLCTFYSISKGGTVR